MKALVVGGTGAIGEHVVGQLLVSDKWVQVVTVGRRVVTVPAEYKYPEEKLKQVVVNMDKLQEEAGAEFSGTDAVFCTLGTTRGAAGSAAQFVKVDYEYVKATAEAAKAGGAKHFSLVTAVGANANLWANDWLICAPLLYTRTKGRAEEIVKAQGIPHVSIFRPGMLDRGDKGRAVEKAFRWLDSIPVQGVAQLLVRDAEAAPNSPPVAVYEMGEMKRALREGGACQLKA